MEMDIENSVVIKGSADRIYAYAADVERWPIILSHYRQVTIEEPGDRDRLVCMHCVRDFGLLHWPCKWRARQELLPEEGRILYTHVSGPAKGMKVEWLLKDGPEGVRTTIVHGLASGSALRRLFDKALLGPLFVRAIASQTLATIKRLVEEGG